MKKVINFPLQTGLRQKILIPITTIYLVNFKKHKVNKIKIVNNLTPFLKNRKQAS